MSLAIGCNESPSAPPKPGRNQTTFFDIATVGTVTGQVTWEGEIPSVPPFKVHANFLAPNTTNPHMHKENPHAPCIDQASGGIEKAFVFLRGVDPGKARPWSHPPVRVEQGDYQLDVVQGSCRGLVGFLRQGDMLEMVATKPIFHSLRARGAAFFTLAFADPHHIQHRPLAQKGLVELSSGAGYYWMRGYLFVDDHPYYTRTDKQGRFTLDQVPPGHYKLVCWLPNWHVVHQERHPETSLVTRLGFAPPLEQIQTVDVTAKGSVKANFTASKSHFIQN